MIQRIIRKLTVSSASPATNQFTLKGFINWVSVIPPAGNPNAAYKIEMDFANGYAIHQAPDQGFVGGGIVFYVKKDVADTDQFVITITPQDGSAGNLGQYGVMLLGDWDMPVLVVLGLSQ